MLKMIETHKGQDVDACIIWLHGLGADGHDFESIPNELNLPDSFQVRFVFPHAPFRPVTLNGGFPMRAWYNLFEVDFASKEDISGIQKITANIHELIDLQIGQGIPPEKIMVAGFSQGGALALYAGLTYEKRLAGVIALSCYLPIKEHFSENKSPSNFKTPIFMAHGENDGVLPFEFGNVSKQRLIDEGYSVEWHPYCMEHTVCMNQISDISSWIQNNLLGINS